MTFLAAANMKIIHTSYILAQVGSFDAPVFAMMGILSQFVFRHLFRRFSWTLPSLVSIRFTIERLIKCEFTPFLT